MSAIVSLHRIREQVAMSQLGSSTHQNKLFAVTQADGESVSSSQAKAQQSTGYRLAAVVQLTICERAILTLDRQLVVPLFRGTSQGSSQGIVDQLALQLTWLAAGRAVM